MILTPEQRESFITAARPMIEWLNNNCNPHVTVQTDCSRAELFVGSNNYYTEDFIKD